MDIAIEGLTHSYGGHAALVDVSLRIAGGSFVALVGASGSGKSTLLRAINGLVRPDAGIVRVGGRDVTAEEPARLRRSIGYVFQNIGLFPHMSVAENIAIGPRLSGRSVDVAAMLRLVGLPEDYGTRRPAELSGGEQQRVGVARALATEARLVLLDEPFGALDPVTRDALGRAYRALHDRLGLTSVMVTHDMAEALLLADRVLVMAAGRIVADATPAGMLAGEAGPEAAALVAVPARQAAALAALAR
nr:ATP-binding cassette domain-containing protein [Sphingomonas quercus]